MGWIPKSNIFELTPDMNPDSDTLCETQVLVKLPNN